MTVEINSQTAEVELILRCKQGDQEAFGELASRHKRSVLLLALRLTGNLEDAEDIAQETFLKAFDRMASIDAERGVKNWLLKVTTNLCLNHGRARKRRWRASQAMARNFSTDDKQADRAILRLSVREAIMALPSKTQAALTLVSLQGMTHREAAEILNCSEGTVSWRVFQAKKSLRQALGPSASQERSNRKKGGDGE